MCFDDDTHILNFLTNENTFKDSVIYEIAHDEVLCNFPVIHPHCLIEKPIDTVKSTPNSILRLEKSYDLHDKFKSIPNCKTNSYCLRYETINSGIDSNPQPINLGTYCTSLEK